MAELTRGDRLQIMLTREEVKALDDWRFLRRMPSRAAAVRELLKRGLAAEGFMLAEARMSSKAFGVIDEMANGSPPKPPRARNGGKAAS
jgi:hypothetical protein